VNIEFSKDLGDKIVASMDSERNGNGWPQTLRAAAAANGVDPDTAETWRKSGYGEDASEDLFHFAQGAWMMEAKGVGLMERLLRALVSQGKNPTALQKEKVLFAPKFYPEPPKQELKHSGVINILGRPPRE
jgi:hypothetical protein